MSRESNDQYDTSGRLIQGYDYDNQAWVFEGRYETCGHPQDMMCDCYGRQHAGEKTKQPIKIFGDGPTYCKQ